MECAGAGKKAVCFREYLFNVADSLPTRDGYCSAHCESDKECGEKGACYNFPRFGSFCFARCSGPTDCRHPGYACPLGDEICFPDSNLDCDPTANDGRCMAVASLNEKDPKVPGGCLRQTYENLGLCAPTCTLDMPHKCPIEFISADLRHCVYIDTTIDLQLQPTGDKWKGLTCMPYTPRVVRDGEICQLFEACDEGSQCDLYPGGDGRCHKLCMQGGTPGCAMGTCQDALRAGPNGPGLCK